MIEPKRIHRMAPCSQYDIARTQAWIEDMAASGWHLEKDGFLFGLFSFLEGKPKRIRCRLEATDTPGGLFSDTREPTEEARKLYQELGWHWMGRRGQFHIYITDDPGAPELHTDPRVQAITIKALTKFYRSALANTLITFLLDFFLIFDWHIALFAVVLGFWPMVFILVSLLAVPLSQLWNVIRFYRLRKKLESGITPPQRKDYRKFRWYYYLKTPVTTVLTIGILLWLVCFRLDTKVDLEDWTQPLPFATIQNIFPEAQIDTDSGWYGGNSVSTFSDWFTPVNIEYHEAADITLPDGAAFWGDINVLYHETKYDWFAMQVAKEHETDVNGGVFDRLFTDEVEINPLEGLDADYAVAWDNIYHYVLICKDNEVIRVSYNHRIAEYFTPAEFAQLILDSIQ